MVLGSRQRCVYTYAAELLNIVVAQYMEVCWQDVDLLFVD